MPEGPQPVEIPVAPPTSESTPQQSEQKGFQAKKFAEKIRKAFSKSGNAKEALQDISDSDPNETPAATKSKHAANKEYRQRMKQVVRENYNWTGFAKETYKHEDFVHQEREAYAKAYGDDALAARDAATPQPEKPEQKQEEHTEPSGDSSDERVQEILKEHSDEIREVMKEHSDEQLQDRIALGGQGADVAQKMLEERQGQQTTDETPVTPDRETHSPDGDHAQGEAADDGIPTDKRELFLFEKEHFDPLLTVPKDQIKDAFTPQIIDLYRRFLQHKVKSLIDNKPTGTTYPDTVAGVLGNNPAFLQRLIYSQTDQVVDMDSLLKEPFSKLAAIMKLELPDNYGQHFHLRQRPNGTDNVRELPNQNPGEPEEWRDAA